MSTSKGLVPFTNGGSMRGRNTNQDAQPDQDQLVSPGVQKYLQLDVEKLRNRIGVAIEMKRLRDDKLLSEGIVVAQANSPPSNTLDIVLKNMLEAAGILDLRTNGKTTVDHSRDTVEFAGFPRLPPELRAKIWKQVFLQDPRNIKVLRIRDWESPMSSGPPVALSVNRESRGEALRHYSLLPFPGNISGVGWDGWHSYVGPNDAVFMNCSSIGRASHNLQADLVSWIKSLKANFTSEVLSKVRLFDVRGTNLSKPHLEEYLISVIRDLFNSFDNARADNPADADHHGLLTLFPSLRTVYLTADEGAQLDWGREEMQVLQRVQAKMDEKKDFFLNHKAPRLVPRNFVPLVGPGGMVPKNSTLSQVDHAP